MQAVPVEPWSQRPLEQFAVTAVGQVLLPLQKASAVATPFVQLAGRHCVLGSAAVWQTPPWHVSSVHGLLSFPQPVPLVAFVF